MSPGAVRPLRPDRRGPVRAERARPARVAERDRAAADRRVRDRRPLVPRPVGRASRRPATRRDRGRGGGHGGGGRLPRLLFRRQRGRRQNGAQRQFLRDRRFGVRVRLLDGGPVRVVPRMVCRVRVLVGRLRGARKLKFVAFSFPTAKDVRRRRGKYLVENIRSTTRATRFCTRTSERNVNFCF